MILTFDCVRPMFFETVKCKLEGDRMILPNGVRRFLSKNYNMFGDFFALVKRNYFGSYDVFHVLRITSENTLEERGDS